MIELLAEVFAILAGCFLAGGLIGWLLSRGLRPLLARMAARPRREGGDDEAAMVVPLPAPVPVLPPTPRREPRAAAIDIAPVRSPAGRIPAGRTTVDQAPEVASARPRPPPAPSRIRPPALAGPRQGRADPLTRIGGLGRRHADRLYAVGIYHFSQIAAWTPREVAWIADYLALGDVIDQEDWVGQAARLAATAGPGRPPRG